MAAVRLAAAEDLTACRKSRARLAQQVQGMRLARASGVGLDVAVASAPWASSLFNDDALNRRISPFFSILEPAASEKSHQALLEIPERSHASPC